MAKTATFPDERILDPIELIQLMKESNLHGGRFCFILGSGASKSAGIPLGTEFEQIWMDCLMDVAPDDGYSLPPHVTEKRAKALFSAKKIDHDFDQIKKAWQSKKLTSEYYFDIYKLRFYGAETTGYRYLEAKMEGIKPSLGYYILALLMTEKDQNNVAITTNFDSLLEDAIISISQKRPLVAGHESLASFISLDRNRPIIAKVHRSLFYAPFNSPETTNKLCPEWRTALRPVFEQYTPIVVGYGGGDKSLMPFLREKNTKMNNGVYWCYRGNLPDTKIQKFVLDKGGYLVKIDSFDDLLLRIGRAFFGSRIETESIRSYLENQTNAQVAQYKEQWNKCQSNEEMKKQDKSFKIKESRKEKAGKLEYLDYVRRADRAEYKHNYAEAIKQYTNAINLQPQNAMAYNNRGFLYGENRQYKEAIQDLNKAIELNLNFAEAYCNRGTVHIDLGQNYKDGIVDLSRAIELMPDFITAYNNRGFAYNAEGQYDKAIADLSKAILLNPKFEKAFCNRGFAYWKKEQYDEALKDLNKAIKLDQYYARAYDIRGCVYDKLGNFEQALNDLNEAKKLDPNNIEILKHLESIGKK